MITIFPSPCDGGDGGESTAYLLPWQWPRLGTSRGHYCDTQMSPSSPVLYLGAGNAGVVREVWWTVACLNDITNGRLRVWVDAGNISDFNNPPSEKLLVDLPFSCLGFFTLAAIQQQTITNRWVWSATRGSPTYWTAFRIGLPIPFVNGILIQVGELSGGTWYPATGDGWSWTTYELGSLPTWRWQDCRLKAKPVEATTNAGNPTVTWLNEASGKGVLAGLYLQQKNQVAAGSFDWLETNLQLKPDGESQPLWQSSGTEDFFGVNGFYFTWGTPVELDYGTVVKVPAGVSGQYPGHESYRWLTDAPLFWNAGAVGLYPVDYEGAFQDAVWHRFLPFYYQEVS